MILRLCKSHCQSLRLSRICSPLFLRTVFQLAYQLLLFVFVLFFFSSFVFLHVWGRLLSVAEAGTRITESCWVPESLQSRSGKPWARNVVSLWKERKGHGLLLLFASLQLGHDA